MSWASTEGATNSGTVEFRDLGHNRTELALTLEYQPAGVVEKVGNLLHVVCRQAEHDLKKFKEFIEHEGHVTGAWRESIPGAAATAEPGTEPRPYNRFEHPFDQTGGLVDFEGESDEQLRARTTAPLHDGIAITGREFRPTATSSGSPDQPFYETDPRCPLAPSLFLALETSHLKRYVGKHADDFYRLISFR
ncbi:SRPBCC family protein [Arthrobacter sp. D3-16]